MMTCLSKSQDDDVMMTCLSKSYDGDIMMMCLLKAHDGDDVSVEITNGDIMMMSH